MTGEPATPLTALPGPAEVGPLELVELSRVRVPMLEPFVASHGTEVERDVVLVRVVGGDGVEGWGECSTLSHPTYSPEHTAGAFAVLREELAPALLAGRADVLAAAGAAAPMASAAVATAVADLGLRRAGRSLAEGLGARRSSVPFVSVLGRRASIDETLVAVERGLAGGASGVKLKIAPGWDVEPLAAIRAAWPDVWLAADANGSYGDEVPPRLAVRLADLDLAYLEQPTARSATAAGAVVRRAGLAVALDESIGSVAELEDATAAGALDVVNVKPARVGGPADAARLARRASAEGLRVFVGGMLETGVGRAAALAVAALDECTDPTDLGPSAAYFASDLTEPIVTRQIEERRELVVPDGAGIGVSPIPAVLDEVTVDRAVVGIA